MLEKLITCEIHYGYLECVLEHTFSIRYNFDYLEKGKNYTLKVLNQEIHSANFAFCRRSESNTRGKTEKTEGSLKSLRTYPHFRLLTGYQQKAHGPMNEALLLTELFMK